MTSGCQSGFGSCGNATPPGGEPETGGTSTIGRCGLKFGTCALKQCCSLEGYCGTTTGRIYSYSLPLFFFAYET